MKDEADTEGQEVEDRQRAAENLALHGRTKKERGAKTTERRRAARELDGKKLD